MQTLLDNLIFPAPSSSYTADSLAGKLIYVPKFEIYSPPCKSIFETKQIDACSTAVHPNPNVASSEDNNDFEIKSDANSTNRNL